MTKYIFNHSTLMAELATDSTCPRCAGHGAICGDIDNCTICNGYGRVWLSNSGWTLKKYGHYGKHEQLY